MQDSADLDTLHVYLSCSGCLAYEKIVKQLLDGDYYAMYSPAGVDNTQVMHNIVHTLPLATSLRGT